MKVKELIEELSEYSPEAHVAIRMCGDSRIVTRVYGIDSGYLELRAKEEDDEEDEDD